MARASMALTVQQKAVLDLVGNQLHARELWTSGRELRAQLSEGTAAEKTAVLAGLVPAYLVRAGQPPQEQYRFTLEGAFESSFGHAVGQFLRDLLDVLKALGRRDSTFDAYSIDDIRRGSHHIALAFPDDYRWIDFVIRIAGLCADPDGAPQGGPWHVPEDIETLLECKDVQALRRLRRGDLHDPTGRIMDPKATLGLEDVHIALLDRIAEYELEHAEPTPINHALLAAPPERENDVHERLDVLSAKDCIEIVGFSGPELLPLRPWGLLASKCAARADAMIRRLLSYFRDQLAAEGVNFRQFTWENLKAAGVAAGDLEFSWFVQLIQMLGLHSGGTHGPYPTPHGVWGVPQGIAQLRGANDIADILVQDEFKPRERSSMRRQPEPSSKETAMTADPKKVFIIHGRNIAAKNAVEHFVQSLGLESLEFDQVSADLGGSAFVGDVVRAGLERAQGIIALFTPDEFSTLRPDHRGTRDKAEDVQRWQARPNVVFEAGMAYGMDPKRTVLVTIGGEVSLFSDVGGVHVVRLTNTSGRSTLRQKLIGMGCAVNERADAWTDPARSGDFESCIAGLSEVSPSDPFAEPAVVSEPDDEGFDGLGEEAARILKWLCAEYIKAGFPPHKTWNFSPSNDEQLAIFRELRAHDWIETMGAGEKKWRLTDMGQMLARRRK